MPQVPHQILDKHWNGNIFYCQQHVWSQGTCKVGMWSLVNIKWWPERQKVNLGLKIYNIDETPVLFTSGRQILIYLRSTLLLFWSSRRQPVNHYIIASYLFSYIWIFKCVFLSWQTRRPEQWTNRAGTVLMAEKPACCKDSLCRASRSKQRCTAACSTWDCREHSFRPASGSIERKVKTTQNSTKMGLDIQIFISESSNIKHVVLTKQKEKK